MTTVQSNTRKSSRCATRSSQSRLATRFVEPRLTENAVRRPKHRKRLEQGLVAKLGATSAVFYKGYARELRPQAKPASGVMVAPAQM
jgi:hypothetical protein